MSKAEDFLQHDGRLFDGWSMAVGLKDGQVLRLCDPTSPASMWARIQQAKKDGGDVVFNGCRTEANGKVDGWGVVQASDILNLRNFGPSVIGAGSVEARLVAVESDTIKFDAALANVGERLTEVETALDELEDDELPEGATMGPDGSVIMPLDPGPVAPEAREAITAGAAADEEG